MEITSFWLLLLVGVAARRQAVLTRLASMRPHNCLSRGREFISCCEVASDLRAAGASIEQTHAEYSVVAVPAPGLLPVEHLETS